MDKTLHSHLRKAWTHHLGILDASIDRALADLQGLLRIDAHLRHGREAASLKESLGPFAENNIHVGSLAETLPASDDSLSQEALERIHALIKRLKDHQDRCAHLPGALPHSVFAGDLSAVLDAAEDHFRDMTPIFADLRKVPLERKSGYVPTFHDPYFSAFDWQALTPAEWTLCPPFPVIIEADGKEEGLLSIQVLQLLSHGLPLKVIMTRASLRRTYVNSAGTRLPARVIPELSWLSLRGLDVLQDMPGADGFENRFLDVLTSSHPGLISLHLPPCEAKEDIPGSERIRTARESHLFPFIRYQPSADGSLCAPLQITGNPETASAQRLMEAAAGDADFAEDFLQPNGQEEIVPLQTFLDLNLQQRQGKVAGFTVDGKVLRLSSNLMTQTEERLELWKALQELTGKQHPVVLAERRQRDKDLIAREAEVTQSMQKAQEAALAEHERKVIGTAVQRIIATFTGVDPGPPA